MVAELTVALAPSNPFRRWQLLLYWSFALRERFMLFSGKFSVACGPAQTPIGQC
jgi:hypothetical protein